MSPVVAPGFTDSDAAHHRVIGDVDQSLGLQLHVADEIHAAGVAVPAVDDHGDVDIDDVAVAQRLVVRNAVADDVVDRGAERVAIAAIAEAGRNAAMRGGVVEGQLVEIFGGDAGLHLGNEQVEHLGGQPAGAAHALEVLRLVQSHREMGPAGRFEHIGLRHDGHGRLLIGWGRLM